MKKMNPLHCLTEVIDVEIKNQEASSSSSDSENSCDEGTTHLLHSSRGVRPSSSPGPFNTPSVGPTEHSSTTTSTLAARSSLNASHQIKHLFHSDLSVVTFNHVDYLIGVQVARRLKRKTFNMYRCMKKKKIELRRATQEEVDYLTLVGAVHPGTHSITLVPFVECLCFVADALFRHIRFPNEDVTAKRRKSFVSMHPRIHRRKPLPWDIQRAVRKTTPPTPPPSLPLSSPTTMTGPSPVLSKTPLPSPSSSPNAILSAIRKGNPSSPSPSSPPLPLSSSPLPPFLPQPPLSSASYGQLMTMGPTTTPSSLSPSPSSSPSLSVPSSSLSICSSMAMGNGGGCVPAYLVSYSS